MTPAREPIVRGSARSSGSRMLCGDAAKLDKSGGNAYRSGLRKREIRVSTRANAGSTGASTERSQFLRVTSILKSKEERGECLCVSWILTVVSLRARPVRRREPGPGPPRGGAAGRRDGAAERAPPGAGSAGRGSPGVQRLELVGVEGAAPASSRGITMTPPWRTASPSMILCRSLMGMGPPRPPSIAGTLPSRRRQFR
jgi:hypothetical protein